jgi:hypothetical protein
MKSPLDNILSSTMVATVAALCWASANANQFELLAQLNSTYASSLPTQAREKPLELIESGAIGIPVGNNYGRDSDNQSPHLAPVAGDQEKSLRPSLCAVTSKYVGARGIVIEIRDNAHGDPVKQFLIPHNEIVGRIAGLKDVASQLAIGDDGVKLTDSTTQGRAARSRVSEETRTRALCRVLFEGGGGDGRKAAGTRYVILDPEQANDVDYWAGIHDYEISEIWPTYYTGPDDPLPPAPKCEVVKTRCERACDLAGGAGAAGCGTIALAGPIGAGVAVVCGLGLFVAHDKCKNERCPNIPCTP